VRGDAGLTPGGEAEKPLLAETHTQ